MTRSIGWTVALLALAACGGSTAGQADGGEAVAADAAGAADARLPGADAGPAADASEPDAAAPACTALLADAGLSRSGYRLDGWSWTRHGVLFEPPAAADGDLAPSLASDGAALHLFFTRKQGLQHRLHHAVSRDGGDTWTVGASPVTGLGDDDVIAFPAALWEDGRFRLWFGSGALDYAESADGDAWTVVEASVLLPGESGAFDGLSVLYPAIARDAAGYRLLYTGYDGTGYAIGRADSADGRSFTRVGSGPLLAKGAASDADNRAVAQAALVRAGGKWLVWYGAYDTSKTDPGPYRIALATSEDGLAFEKRGITLELSESGSEAWSTRDPAVLRTATGWLMVYSGMGDDGRYRLLRATSATCAP